MSDPHVREIGRIEDMDGNVLTVGVDYDAVTIGWPTGPEWRIESSQADEFAALYVSACWQAAAQAANLAAMAGENSG
jgi:hypothetical protein